MATVKLTGSNGSPLLVNWDNVTCAEESKVNGEFTHTQVHFVAANITKATVDDTAAEIYAQLHPAKPTIHRRDDNN